MSRKLYEQLDGYQREAVDWSDGKDAIGLFFEQGTGKTWITGGIIERRWKKDLTALIISPMTNKMTTWVKFLKSQLPPCHVCLSREEFDISPSRAKILVLHYEMLVPGKINKKGMRKVDWKFVKSLARLDWSVVVFDESHRLKNRNSGWSKAANRLRDCAETRIILSGTPIEAKPQDLWAQFRFLDPDILGTWKEFEEEFFEPLDNLLEGVRRGSYRFLRLLRIMQMKKNKREFRQDRLKRFITRIEPHSLRVTAEVLNLKPMIIQKVPVKLRGEQRRVYDELEADLVSFLDKESRVTAPLKITQLGKLHQVCGGFVADDEGDTQEVGRAKLRETLSIIRQYDEPIAIFCRYREEVKALYEAIRRVKQRVGKMTGSTKAKDRQSLQEAFQAGELDVLILQIKTGGVGIDLYRGRIGILYSITYSSIDFDQAVKRLHRRGQRKAVKFFLLLAQDTIDEYIYEAIVSKRKVIDLVLNKLKPGAKNGQEGRSCQEAVLEVRRLASRGRTRHSAGECSRGAS